MEFSGIVNVYGKCIASVQSEENILGLHYMCMVLRGFLKEESFTKPSAIGRNNVVGACNRPQIVPARGERRASQKLTFLSWIDIVFCNYMDMVCLSGS